MAEGPREEPSLHEPVLLCEVLDLLALRPGASVLDGTVGGGGHAEAILERTSPDGPLIGIDRDGEILEAARSRLSRFGSRVQLYQAKLSQAPEVLERVGVSGLDAFLLDLGVSSLQLDRAERGFSFRNEGPLDMRMDRDESCWTAADVIQRMTERDLAWIFHRYGEEPRSRGIAKAIVERRRKAPFRTTGDLAAFVEAIASGRGRIHPATRVFQALRIAVNQELEELQAALAALLPQLRGGGRAAVISFHSLEDRLVKEEFRKAARSGGYRLLTKKPVVAGAEEYRRNRRSRSAKLRALERIS